MYIENIPPEPSPLYAEQSQFSQASLIGELLLSLHHPCDSDVSLILRSPKLDTEIQLWPLHG